MSAIIFFKVNCRLAAVIFLRKGPPVNVSGSLPLYPNYYVWRVHTYYNNALPTLHVFDVFPCKEDSKRDLKSTFYKAAGGLTANLRGSQKHNFTTMTTTRRCTRPYRIIFIYTRIERTCMRIALVRIRRLVHCAAYLMYR